MPSSPNAASFAPLPGSISEIIAEPLDRTEPTDPSDPTCQRATTDADPTKCSLPHSPPSSQADGGAEIDGSVWYWPSLSSRFRKPPEIRNGRLPCRRELDQSIPERPEVRAATNPYCCH